MSFLNQRKGENGRRNYFITNLNGSNVAGLKFELATPGQVRLLAQAELS